jgi:AmmeMemoRadiSam system protein B
MEPGNLRPCLRQLDIYPITRGADRFLVFRDPEGFSSPVVLPHLAGAVAGLLDGERTLDDIQREFQARAHAPLARADLERFIAELDELHLLESPRFMLHSQQQVEGYLAASLRPAAHAGGAYAGEPKALEAQLEGLFTCAEGPGEPDFTRSSAPAQSSDQGQLRGVLSPHIDLHRGGPSFAFAYKRLAEETNADVFVIFGTAHNYMRQPFCVSQKDFATPLGNVTTNRPFIDALVANLRGTPAAGQLDLFADELAHRNEHSIEFQVVFLQYLLGERRPFTIVPILVGSFHEFVSRRDEPLRDPMISSFVSALRAVEAQYADRVCYISGGDLAHIGRRFGDAWTLDDARLKAQSEQDHELLAKACQADSSGFFQHVARQNDASRICGLSPTYTMLEVMQPGRGEFLKYSQAVEGDRSACVSFASLAFYG